MGGSLLDKKEKLLIWKSRLTLVLLRRRLMPSKRMPRLKKTEARSGIRHWSEE